MLEGVKQFRIPLFQRRYTWGPKEHEQLWRDVMGQYDALAEAAAEGRLAAHTATHFIGSFVLAPTESSASSAARFLVVDGQQRLTTLSIALCALRDVWADLDREAGDEINETYLINKFKKGQERYKLLPTQDDRGDYFAIVDSTPSKATTDSRISDAYRFFLARIGEATAAEEEDCIELARLKDVLVSKLSVVDITADRDDNVHRIFESLNATGVDLTQGDLLRNYIFMLLPSEERAQRVYSDLWAPMEAIVGVSNIEPLARLDLLRRGAEVLSDDVYRGQQARLRQYEGDEDAIEAQVADLLRQASFFQRILDPGKEEHAGIRGHLHFFKRWGAQTVNPIVMYAYNLRDEDRISDDQMQQLLLNIESFLVRRLLTGVRGGNLNRIFLRVVKKLIESEPDQLVDVARWELSSERAYWATDSDIEWSVSSRPFYFYGRAEQKRMVLEAIERSFGHKEASDLEAMSLSIEHIMPQTLTEEWKTHLSEQGDDPESTRSELLHTLGNLTLTAYNPQLSNKPLERKKEIYESSLLAMNQPIASASAWGRSQITMRAESLATRIVDIWPAPEARVTDGPSELWAPLHEACAVLPPGSWASYSELAVLVGTSPIAVGNYIGKNHVTNAHRVMNAAGHVAPGFHWIDPDDDRDVRTVLETEGLVFGEDERAMPERRMTAADLQERITHAMGEDD